MPDEKKILHTVLVIVLLLVVFFLAVKFRVLAR
jgi:hypothetical protein